MTAHICSTIRRTAKGGVLLTTLAGVVLATPAFLTSQRPDPSPVPADQARFATADVTPNADADATMEELSVPAVDDRAAAALLPRTRTETFNLVGVTWDPGFREHDLIVQVSTHGEQGWTSWQPLEIEVDGPPEDEGGRAGTSPAWVGDADGIGVRVFTSSGQSPEGLEVAVIDGGTGLAWEPREFEPRARKSSESLQLDPVAATTDGVVDRPEIVTRDAWGATGDAQSCDPPRTASTMAGIVVHHTVGSNDYTREESPGIVRSIQLYHRKSLGWCDIGYNFLVDRFGTVYEGRAGGIDLQVRGAHAGNWDVNLATTGISMMGDFETDVVPRPLKRAVTRLAAWRLSSFGLGAFGKITFDGVKIPRVSGHRDVYLSGVRPATATACPGEHGYDWLNSGTRRRIQDLIDAAAATAPEPTPEPTPEPEPEPTPPPTMRMSGTNRYATAAAISQETFSGPVPAVFLAAGATFPDALSAGPAAARKAGPVLLTRSDALPAETAVELERLQPSTVYVLGGTAAVSEEVAVAAGRYAGEVVRLAGANRYKTGILAIQHVWGRAATVYLASGAGYPDALAGGALAAHEGAPILLSRQDGMPKAVRHELARLSPTRVVLLGGEGALSTTIETQVRETVPGVSLARLAGADRYETAAAIADAGWSSSGKVFVAGGWDFPDGLSGVPAAAAHGAPLMLTKSTCMPAPAYDAMTSLGPDTKVLLGGKAVLAESAATTRCAD